MIEPAARMTAGGRPTHVQPEATMDRRKLLQWSGAASALGAATALPERAAAAPGPALPSALQRAIDRAAAARVPLVLPPGVYRVGALKLPAGAQLIGMRGATRLVYSG